MDVYSKIDEIIKELESCIKYNPNITSNDMKQDITEMINNINKYFMSNIGQFGNFASSFLKLKPMLTNMNIKAGSTITMQDYFMYSPSDQVLLVKPVVATANIDLEREFSCPFISEMMKKENGKEFVDLGVSYLIVDNINLGLKKNKEYEYEKNSNIKNITSQLLDIFGDDLLNLSFNGDLANFKNKYYSIYGKEKIDNLFDYLSHQYHMRGSLVNSLLSEIEILVMEIAEKKYDNEFVTGSNFVQNIDTFFDGIISDPKLAESGIIYFGLENTARVKSEIMERVSEKNMYTSKTR